MEILRRQGLQGCLRVQMPLRGGRGGGCMVPPLTTMFLQAIDVPDTDLLHHFERCCQFIKQGVEQGGILVHFCA